MWTGIPYCSKFESSPGYKTVLNSAMSYLVRLMMTGPEFLEDLKNNQINLQPEHNPMALDKTMMDIWNKQALELRRREDQWEQDVADRLTRFEAYRVSISSYRYFI